MPKVGCTRCTIASGVVTDVGSYSDEINILIYWDSQFGYVFDYKNPNKSPYHWTVETLWPSGTYSTMNDDRLGMGQAQCKGLCVILNYAYWSQVGVVFSGALCQNVNWQLVILDTQYQPTVSSSNKYLVHAWTMQMNIRHDKVVYMTLSGKTTGLCLGFQLSSTAFVYQVQEATTPTAYQ